MKSCPTCNSTYPRDFSLCPRDGTKLIEVGVWSEGTLIRGKYRIIGKIGVGGMAAVFKAMHIRFEELRALKVISSELASDPSFVKRLQQEAVVTRRLQHPNAVRVEDIDEAEDGRPFIVMEYIEGRSLKDLIEEAAPLPVGRTLSIIKQAASALDAAHALGILHRDIKPANIVLVQTPEGEQAKVLDFGIAKVKEANLGETAEMTLTGQGRVVGTSAYMSPEQAMGMRGEELDGRSDLYSLGVVMYQMLVGELPLKAESEVSMLMAHIQMPPRPIRELRPDIPQPVAGIVMSCLEKNRELRPKSGRALIGVIEDWQRSEAVAPPAVPGPDQTILYREAYREASPLAPAAGQVAASSRSFSAVPSQPAGHADPFAPKSPAETPPLAVEQPPPEATIPASGLWAAGPSLPAPPHSHALTGAQEFQDGATMMVSGLGSAPEPTDQPPPHPATGAPELYPPVEPTMLASGFDMGPASQSPAAPAPAASGDVYPDDIWASGSGTQPEGDLPVAPHSNADTDAYPKGEATSFASAFGTSPEREPSHSSPLGAGADTYPGGEATRLASGFGSPESSYQPSTRPPLDDGAPAFHDEAGGGFSADASAVGMPKVDAPYGTPASTPAWDGAAEAPQAAPQAAPEAAPRKSSNWMIWAAVPVVAAVLTLGAWFFLSRGLPSSPPEGGTSSSPPSQAQPSTTAPTTSPGAGATSSQPANGGTSPQQTGQQAPSASGSQPKPDEAKPAEAKPGDTKPVDLKAVRALKAEGDTDFAKGNYDNAIRAYRNALKLDPKNGALVQQIARARKAQETERKLLQ